MWLRKRLTAPERAVYPVVIRQARYSGIYEGGKWIATASTSDIPEPEFYDYLTGEDMDAINFFLSPGARYIGRGATPNEAYDDLMRRVKDLL